MPRLLTKMELLSLRMQMTAINPTAMIVAIEIEIEMEVETETEIASEEIAVVTGHTGHLMGTRN